MKYKITQNQKECIGCGACTAVCPKFWKLNNEGKAGLINSKNNELIIEEKDLKCNKEAAESCPIEIIKIEKI